MFRMLPYQTKLVFLGLLGSLPLSFQRSFSGVEVHDYALPGYSFASFRNTRDSFSCAHRCLCHDQCKSYNYALTGAQQGLCELNSAGKEASKTLQYRPEFVFVQAFLKQAKASLSCFDHWKDGARISGKYRIHARADRENFFDVYCDFDSESGWVWTLVISQSFAKRNMSEFLTIPLYTDARLNEDNPNWEAYRLSLEKMTNLKSQSTHWRVTCSFPARGVEGTDYVRANFTEFDPLTFNGNGKCMKVEYLNVRGHSCAGCTSAWWQRSSRSLHHDSSYNSCEFKKSPGSVSSEDNFGSYYVANSNFRCSSSDDANTNHWFGRHGDV